MRIGVDIDGVISDSYPLWLDELNRHYGKNIPFVDDYNMHLSFDVSPEDMNEFFETNVERLLMRPEAISGAREGIESLRQEGHEIIYVTARTLDQEELTAHWFELKGIYYNQVLFTGLAASWML